MTRQLQSDVEAWQGTAAPQPAALRPVPQAVGWMEAVAALLAVLAPALASQRRGRLEVATVKPLAALEKRVAAVKRAV